MFNSEQPAVHVSLLVGHNAFHSMPQKENWRNWGHQRSKWLAFSKAPGMDFLERWWELRFPMNSTVVCAPCHSVRRQLCHW